MLLIDSFLLIPLLSKPFALFFFQNETAPALCSKAVVTYLPVGVEQVGTGAVIFAWV